jgi:hypothetical protein
MKYQNPDFDIEYEEALRYDELSEMSLEEWKRFSTTGKKVKFTTLKDVGNVDTNIMNLEKEKIKRATQHMAKGIVEMPIVLKIDNDYDLLSGNTRLALLLKSNEDPFVYLLDVDLITK